MSPGSGEKGWAQVASVGCPGRSCCCLDTLPGEEAGKALEDCLKVEIEERAGSLLSCILQWLSSL